MSNTSSKVQKRYYTTQYATSVIMVVVTVATLVKIYLQTRKQEGRFRIVYAIMGLSLLSWFLLFVGQFADQAWLIGICEQYLSVLDLGFWLFAWSYFHSIKEQASAVNLQPGQMQRLAYFANITVFSLSLFLALWNTIAIAVYSDSQGQRGTSERGIQIVLLIWNFILSLLSTTMIIASIWTLNRIIN